MAHPDSSVLPCNRAQVNFPDRGRLRRDLRNSETRLRPPDLTPSFRGCGENGLSRSQLSAGGACLIDTVSQNGPQSTNKTMLLGDNRFLRAVAASADRTAGFRMKQAHSMPPRRNGSRLGSGQHRLRCRAAEMAQVRARYRPKEDDYYLLPVAENVRDNAATGRLLRNKPRATMRRPYGFGTFRVTEPALLSKDALVTSDRLTSSGS